MAENFLGTGWKFPIVKNDLGSVALSANEEKVRESILIILSTAKGERVMRPDFGCDIHEFVFTVINASRLTLIKSAVKEALILWEPRIEVLDVETSTEKIKEGVLYIQVDYKIRTTNTQNNLVYPFYLNNKG